MAKQDKATPEVKQEATAPEAKVEAPKEPGLTHDMAKARYIVSVLVNGEAKIQKDVLLAEKAKVMKATRATIRTWGLSITNAVVTDNAIQNEVTKVIKFDGVTLPDKPIRKAASGAKGTSTADFSASDTEIVSIVKDDDLTEDAKREALAGYNRHQLRHAANEHLEANLPVHSAKAKSIEALLA